MESRTSFRELILHIFCFLFFDWGLEFGIWDGRKGEEEYASCCTRGEYIWKGLCSKQLLLMKEMERTDEFLDSPL